MTCEGDYHNMTIEELREHQRFHMQAFNEAVEDGNPKRSAIESLKTQKMFYALSIVNPDMGSEGSAPPLDPDASIAEIDLQLSALEFQGGQTNG